MRRAGHTVNVASITRRRAQMTGPLGNLAKMALPTRMPHPCCCKPGGHLAYPLTAAASPTAQPAAFHLLDDTP